MLRRRQKNSATDTSGEDAEQLAEDFLIKKGLALIARNYRCQWGEIDRIFLDRDVVIFVEVRLRRHKQWSAVLSVDARKQARLRKTASEFLQMNPKWRDAACRFDVIAFNEQLVADWIRDAF